MALLEVRGVCKRFRRRGGDLVALEDAGLSVGEGEVVGLVGASGSGKSTLARAVVGLSCADAGTITFDGDACDASVRLSRRPSGHRRGMQMVFQHPASTFSPRMTLGAGIAEGVAYRGVPRSEHPALVREALGLVGLPASYAERHAWELSGGECQRAAIARAIIGRPRLLVADEPTSALDVTVQAQVVRLLAELCRERGMACLFISHDLVLVSGLCARVYVMEAGRVVEEGTPQTVFSHPASSAARCLADAIVEL